MSNDAVITYRIDVFSDDASTRCGRTCSTGGSVESVYDVPESFGSDLAHAMLAFLPHPEDAYAAYEAFAATMTSYLSEIADFNATVQPRSECAQNAGAAD